MKSAAVILANGFEEIEAITSIDILRRAGIKVNVITLEKISVSGSHDINISCDSILVDDNSLYDCLILPGGMPGANNISKSDFVKKMILNHNKNGKIIAAICAAPGVVLGPLNILKNRPFTCYPGFESRVVDGIFSENSVVVSDNIVTSRGVGTAIPFALKIVELLASPEVSNKLSKALIFS